jgi:hypothetical protein
MVSSQGHLGHHRAPAEGKGKLTKYPGAPGWERCHWIFSQGPLHRCLPHPGAEGRSQGTCEISALAQEATSPPSQGAGQGARPWAFFFN